MRMKEVGRDCTVLSKESKPGQREDCIHLYSSQKGLSGSYVDITPNTEKTEKYQRK